MGPAQYTAVRHPSETHSGDCASIQAQSWQAFHFIELEPGLTILYSKDKGFRCGIILELGLVEHCDLSFVPHGLRAHSPSNRVLDLTCNFMGLLQIRGIERVAFELRVSLEQYRLIESLIQVVVELHDRLSCNVGVPLSGASGQQRAKQQPY